MASSPPSSYFSFSSAPPPPPPPPQIRYDVFLNFRGEDTRGNFISHLHNALDERGIDTFIDNNLNRGDEISPALLTAIEESRISMIIFSEDYASSTWCLKELVKILECKNRETNKQIVIPVFYGVIPSDLRNQTGSVADAFARHEKRFEQNLDQVYRWKDALKEASYLSGWPSSCDRSEAEFIKVIVEDVWQKLDYLSSSDTSNLVGIDSKIKEIESWLCTCTNNVRSVGIWGIGGIGKTTLAEAVFNKISHQFKGCSYFARNIREWCEQSNGLNRLQQELLKALLGDKHAYINTYTIGRTFIKNRLSRKKLLIVFDDLSDFRQIEGLIGGFDCLGPQSRIIITTRDKQVLTNHDVNKVYTLPGLVDNEALELFSMYAFRNKHPTKDYMKLSKRVVNYAGGIPLALKVLGSCLYEKKIGVWKDAIEKMGREPHMEIQKVLKISYDGLDEEVKMIFLDIACFFKWTSIEHVKSALEACGLHAVVGIDDLIDKSLIAVGYGGKIEMHELVEAMAKKIVRQESIDVGKRSRLWDHEEIYHILTRGTGTETIEGIALDMSKIKEDILINPNAFIKMHRLRILKFYGSSSEVMNRVHVSQGLVYDFPALKYLSWHGCSINSPLSSFSLENLAILDMSKSKFNQLWKGVLPLAKLKEVDLSHSHLTSCPDLSGSPNLKTLNLFRCETLREISPSVGRLSELESLNLSLCFSLKAIPDFSGLISLKGLNLSRCRNLKMLHEMPCNLEWLDLGSKVIEELPSSFGNLRKLQNLILCDCTKLQRLPSRICKLKSLVTLYLDGCSELDQLPEDIGNLNSLEIFSANGTAIRELPSSITNLEKLMRLNFSGLEVRWPNRSDSDSDSMADGKEFFEYDLDDRSDGDSMADGKEFSEDDLHNPSDSDSMADGKEFSEDDFHYKVIKFCDSPSKCWRVPISRGSIINVELSNWMMVECLPMLQLEGRCSTAVSFQYCRPLCDYEDNLKNALHALPKVKKVCVLLYYPGSEVPEWFHFRSTRYFISLSPNWLNQSFMAFALCVVVAPNPDCHVCFDRSIKWTCKLKSKDGQAFIRQGSFCIQNFLSVYVFVNSPICPFSPHKICDAKEISFEITAPNRYIIEKCGVHLMYGQDIEEADGSSHVDGDENLSSLADVHNNCEVDEPYSKRLKVTHY